MAEVARAFMFLDGGQVELDPRRAQGGEIGQQAVVQMGVLGEPVGDQRLGGHPWRVNRQERLETCAQTRAA
jgi:hypothetical protein